LDAQHESDTTVNLPNDQDSDAASCSLEDEDFEVVSDHGESDAATASVKEQDPDATAEPSNDQDSDAVSVPTDDERDGSVDPLKDHPIGYPNLAGRMALAPERIIVRTFKRLGVQNILYMQSELAKLEQQLKRVANMDDDDVRRRASERDNREENLKLFRFDDMKKDYTTDWGWVNPDAFKAKGDTKQYDLVMLIRARLKDYGKTLQCHPRAYHFHFAEKALIRQRTLIEMPGPDPFGLRDLQCFMTSDGCGSNCFVGADRNYCGNYDKGPDDHEPDLITMKGRKFDDKFTEYICDHALLILDTFKWFFSPSHVTGTPLIHGTNIQMFIVTAL
jgi:hypothetical protein